MSHWKERLLPTRMIRGWIDAEWKTSEHKQRAKYYRLTRAGRTQLLLEASRWERMVQAIARVMRPV